MHFHLPLCWLAATIALGACAERAAALDYVTFTLDGAEIEVRGEIQVVAADGGLLVQGQDGRLWQIPKDDIRKQTSDDEPFTPLTKEEICAELLKELPAGFACHTTAHYVICYNTSEAYAVWVGSLFERLFKASETFWSHKKYDVVEPPMPLVVLVFSDKQAYRRHAVNELGDAVDSIIGYYNLLTNRVTMYDLTGTTEAGASRRLGSSREINALLSRPEAAGLVATIIHEATHQIAFNSGLQKRMTDTPLWLSEGVSMYFETPDLNSRRGWRGIGAVNYPRLVQFRNYARTRPADSLKTLLQNDDRLRDSQTALDAYAESWALVYYLIRHEPDKFRAYMQALEAKQQLIWDTPEDRIAEFEKHFGPLEKLDSEFLRQTARIR